MKRATPATTGFRQPPAYAAAIGVCLLAALAPRAAAQPRTGPDLAAVAGQDLLGTPAPGLVVETIDGDPIDLGALYGEKAVYLKFWATWCVPCRQQMPHFQEVHETAGPDLAVVGVNTGFNDSLPDVRDLIADAGLTMPTVIDDGRLAAAFNLRVTPQHVVIGRDRRIDYIGFFADEQLDTALRQAQDVPMALGETRGNDAAPRTASTEAERYSIGDELPDLSAVTLDDRAFRTRDGGDWRPTALVFLTPWCESYLAQSRPAIATGCRQVREQVADLASGGDTVRWLGVAAGLWSTADELRTYEGEYAPQIPLMLDETGEWFRAFGVMHTPTIVLADAGGIIVKRVEGFDADLAGAIEEVLAP